MTEPHVLQRHALEALHRELGSSGRGVVVMPCGAGKTLLGRWFAEQINARLAVVFVPTLALIPQTLAAYRSDTSWRHDAMIVCSDPASGQPMAVDDLDLPPWARQSVTSSTSPRAIRNFITGPGPRLLISTYHSAPRVAAAVLDTGRRPDLVVCDEAHRLAGRPRREFRAVLDDDALPAARRLFLTATPVEAAAWADEAEGGGEGGGGEAGRPLTLDDQGTFGPTIYTATFGDAIRAGRLVDYDVQVLAPGNRATRGDPTGGQLDAVLAAAGDGATRILTFHSRVRSAVAVAEAIDGRPLPDGRTVRAEHVEARHRAPRRAAALERLAHPEPGTVQVLCSARVLAEGVDVPAVDTVLFAEPRTSVVDVVQAVGRAMRTAPGKTRGRIVLAVAPERDHDDDTVLAATTWRHVWVTLRALAAMDERFAARLRGTARTRGTEHRLSGPDLSFELPVDHDIERWVLRALDRTGLAWWAAHDALAEWAARHGHARPSPTVRHDGHPIGRWVARQRTLHRAGALDHPRAAALEALPGWAWDHREAGWRQARDLWVRHHQDSAPGSAARRPVRLARTPAWTGHQRPAGGFETLLDFAVDTAARRRRGELPAHLEAAATELPLWDWDLVDPDDAAMVDALAEYGAWKGDLNPPHDYVHDGGRRLGAWLTAIRRRHHTGRLDLALDYELRGLNRHRTAGQFRWDTADTAWRLGYLALAQFVARRASTRVPYEHVEALPDTEIELNRWCVMQRRGHRLGQLAAGRVAALEQIPGWQWEVSPRGGDRPILDDVKCGTRAAYVRGCGCEPCLEANRAYARHNLEHGSDRVSATRARGHLRILLGRGAGQKAIARAAGLDRKTVAEVLNGRRTEVAPETEQALLAVTLHTAKAAEGVGPGGGRVDAAPTWRLIESMLERGWPRAWISREIGHGPALQLNRERITVRNADAVAALDRRLGPTRRAPALPPRTAVPALDDLLAAEQTANRPGPTPTSPPAPGMPGVPVVR